MISDIPILRTERLTKIYPNGIKANQDISIKIFEGEIIGVIGPNGAGKTTLLRQILGLIKPTEGNIYLREKNIKDNPFLISRLIGYVPQIPIYYPALTVEECIRYILQLNGDEGKSNKGRINSTLELLNLQHYAKLSGYQLSGGLQKAVLLGVAWAKGSQILALDEPTSMLDIARKQFFWDQIIKESRREKRSILLSSHDLNEVKKICERIYLLIGGRIIAEGSANDISQLLKMPVELEFITADACDSISYHGLNWQQEGKLKRILFPGLEECMLFTSNLIKLCSIEYLKLETPIFEKVIAHFIHNSKGEL